MKKAFCVIICLLLSIVLLCACNASGQYFIFGTYIELNVEGAGSKKTVDSIEAELLRLENLFSATIEGSDVSNINSAEAGAATKVSVDTIAALEVYREIYELSGGAFDPTVYPLVKLWKFSADTFTGAGTPPPSSEEIQRLLNYVGFDEMLVIDEVNLTVTKAFKEVQIDFGGVAKGYAGGKSVALANGKTALLNLGGNIFCLGKTYKIGIANPRDADTPYYGSMSVADGFSASTSGDYERYYEYGGNRYCHIINPKTGYPVGYDAQGELLADRLVSVTVISNDYAACDALATAAMVLGKDAGEKLLSDLNQNAVIVDSSLNYIVVGETDFVKK